MSFATIYLILSYTSALSFLNGSLVLLIVVGSIKFLPFASKSGTNAMLQLSNEIEEAAIIVGVPWWKRMVKVLFPIQKSSFRIFATICFLYERVDLIRFINR